MESKTEITAAHAFITMQNGEVDQIREAFRQSYKAYLREKLAMGELLLHHIVSTEARQTVVLQEQQLRVDETFRQYEEARSEYVRCFLGEFTEADDALRL